jgi:hypothetical protein
MPRTIVESDEAVEAFQEGISTGLSPSDIARSLLLALNRDQPNTVISYEASHDMYFRFYSKMLNHATVVLRLSRILYVIRVGFTIDAGADYPDDYIDYCDIVREDILF